MPSRLINSKITTKVIIAGTITFFCICITIVLRNADKNMRSNTVTELVVTPFGYPHPYKLNYVAQYRFVHQICEFLIRRDDRQNLIGGLAKSWTISEDRSSITFHLRPNLYNATEVKESLVRFIKTGQTSHSNINAQINSENDIQVENELTLTIYTRSDAAAILAPLVMADMAILPNDHWVTVNGIEQVDWKKIKGVYKYVSGEFPLEVNKELIFQPNANHYFYSNELPMWKLRYLPIESINNIEELESILNESPSYLTVRYWEMFKIFTKDSSVKLDFYETRPNGITFLILNSESGVFNYKQARITLLKRILNSKIELLNDNLRAFQIAQPGLSGKLSQSELTLLINKINSEVDYIFNKPIRWLIPNGPGENSEWVNSIAINSELPFEKIEGKYSDAANSNWKKGNFDIAVLSVGMSDTDPVSGASFLFSPAALGQDLEDGKILKLLNSAKLIVDRKIITEKVKESFRLAMEEGLIVPISYVTNRHFHSKNVSLNINDPYSESIRIWEVRVKD